MNTRAFVALAGGLAVAGSVSAQINAFNAENTATTPDQAVEPPAQIQQPLPLENNQQGLDHAQLEINHDLHDGHTEIDDLGRLAEKSHDIFEAVLIDAQPVQLPNSLATSTEYTFAVTEWFKGDFANQTVTYTEVGYLDENQAGAYTCLSHKLYVGSRYLVFGRANPQEMSLPFERVLQIKDDGRVLGNEKGVPAVALNGNQMVFIGDRTLETLSYDKRGLGFTPTAGNAGAPTPTDGSIAPPQPSLDAPQLKPINAQFILDNLRDITWGQTDAAGAAFEPPAGISEPDDLSARYIFCGYVTDAIGYRGWIPGANELNWWNSVANDWNNVVQPGGIALGFLIGTFNDWVELPGFNDGVNDSGLPTSTHLVNGGYGNTWAGFGNPSGISWTWQSGCGIITQADAFTNPVNTGNELQFRKTTVHELGHNLALDHVTAQYGILVSGTWRVPPNYVLSENYCRLDDYLGVRAWLNWVNANINANQWWFENWADIATYSQSVASSVYTMTGLNDYSLQSGQAFTINAMHVENRGLNSMSNVQIKWYLSTNTIISTFDTQISSASWTTFGAQSHWQNGTWNTSVPSTMPSGTYYLGWILTSDTTDFKSGNNTGIMRWSSSSSFSPRTVTVTCPTPNIPSGLAASDGSFCSGVNLTWNAAAGATSYGIYRNTVNSTGSATLITTDTASPYFDSSATPGQTYYYWVRSNNGCGSISSYSFVNSGYRATVPAIPSGVSATQGTICGKVLIDWSAVSGATSYTIYRNTVNTLGTATFLVSVSSAFTSWNDSTGPDATGLYYWVRANNGCGAGSYAASVFGYYFYSGADLTTTGAAIGDPGYGVPDGQVTGADINFYVNAYVAGDAGIADITTQGAGVGDPGYGVPDGLITAADINFYVNLWNLGCF